MSAYFTTEMSDPRFEIEGLRFITVKSRALNRRADMTVFNPAPSSCGLPIVILLHGVYGSHWAWTMKGGVHRTARRLIDAGRIKPVVLVMPSDGLFGDGSGYVPHQTEDYEKWIVEDVIQTVREQISSVSDDSPVFIAGLSMGGYGALRLGAKYPEKFLAFSGLSSITHFDQIGLFVENFDELKAKAASRDGVLDWMLIHRDRLPPFRFDCGEEDLLIEHNRQLHDELNAHGILHIYEEYSGGHTWSYWEEHIVETLQFFNHQLNRETHL